MSKCSRYSTTIANACRDAQPGVASLYIGNFTDLLSFTVNADGVTIPSTGLTMSGTTKFYEVALNKQVGQLIDQPTINTQNGVAVSKPKMSFKVQGLTSDAIAMYKSLLQADVIVVIRTINGDLFGVGFNNGLSMSVGTIGTESNIDGFIGASFELDGIESAPFYKIDMTASNFETVYVTGGGGIIPTVIAAEAFFTNDLVVDFSTNMSDPSSFASDVTVYINSVSATTTSVILNNPNPYQIIIKIAENMISTDTITISIAGGNLTSSTGGVFAGVTNYAVANTM